VRLKIFASESAVKELVSKLQLLTGYGSEGIQEKDCSRI
jgi:hypothetical protein